MKTLLITISLAVFFFAPQIARAQKDGKPPSKMSPSVSNSATKPEEQAQGQAGSQDTVITLRRYADAFNNGTDYDLTINGDGTVAFKRFANPFVSTTDPRSQASATVKTTIPVEKVAELVAEFERIKYFSLKDRYAEPADGCPVMWTDQGGANTSITINGRTKTISHYYGCRQEPHGPIYPAELTALEKKIDDVVGTSQWLK